MGFSYRIKGNDQIPALIPHKTVFESSLFSSVGACSFRTMRVYQRTLRTLYVTLSPRNSTLLAADTALYCKKKPVPN